jgi:hypothetical protein
MPRGEVSSPALPLVAETLHKPPQDAPRGPSVHPCSQRISVSSSLQQILIMVVLGPSSA